MRLFVVPMLGCQCEQSGAKHKLLQGISQSLLMQNKWYRHQHDTVSTPCCYGMNGVSHLNGMGALMCAVNQGVSTVSYSIWLHMLHEDL